DSLHLREMGDDLLVGHSMEAMEVELAVSNVRGEVLDVERLPFREAHAAQFRVGFGEHLFRRGKFHGGEQADEAAVDRIGGGARKLLENDIAHQRLEAFAARLDSKRTDLRNDPCENRVGLAKMHSRLARIWDSVSWHRTQKRSSPNLARLLSLFNLDYERKHQTPDVPREPPRRDAAWADSLRRHSRAGARILAGGRGRESRIRRRCAQ